MREVFSALLCKDTLSEAIQMIIDTHTHIYEKEFDDDREEVVRRAKEAGVGMMVLPNIDWESTERMKRLYESDKKTFRMAMGLHPTEVGDDWKDELAKMKEEMGKGEYVAVGEIGMDLYWETEKRKEQMEALETQLEWAKEKGMAALIHCRNAWDETMGCIRNSGVRKGVMHCFGGSADEAKEAIEMGMKIGIGGVVTYKKSTLPEALKEIELRHIVLETDAPYLSPVPHRGKRNEPSYLPHVVGKLAEIYGVSEEEVISATARNAEEMLF